MKTVAIALFVFCLARMTGQAQATGMICAMAFDDRDRSGSHDLGEPPITGGIGYSLQNEFDVTLATRLLEESAEAARGFVCFGGLEAGEYKLVLTSAQYQPTTATTFSAAVVPGQAPARFDFGASPLYSARQTRDAGLQQLSEAQLRSLQGIGIGLLGALLTACVTLFLGLLIYVGVFRRRLRRARAADSAAAPPAPTADAP